ncbi:MAG: TlpA disulfide reductase family protein [Spirochaetota bacterium]
MKMAILRKVMIIPVMGILLMATSCKAQKQPSEQAEVNQKSEAKPSVNEAQKAPSTAEAPKSSPSNAMPALDFTLQSIRNQKVSLTDFLGNKIVLINFWATWCPYCVAEIPHLNKIEKSLAEQVKFLSIDIGEKPEKVQNFARQKGVVFDVLLDQQGEVARRYRVKGTPTNIVIDKKGNIAYYGYELNKAEQVIMRLLAN